MPGKKKHLSNEVMRVKKKRINLGCSQNKSRKAGYKK